MKNIFKKAIRRKGRRQKNKSKNDTAVVHKLFKAAQFVKIKQ